MYELFNLDRDGFSYWGTFEQCLYVYFYGLDEPTEDYQELQKSLRLIDTAIKKDLTLISTEGDQYQISVYVLRVLMRIQLNIKDGDDPKAVSKKLLELSKQLKEH
jgi:hypothetical protein